MLRSDGKLKTVDDFGGCNQLIDEIKLPNNFVRWSNGGLYTERKEFERIPGKVAVGTSSAFGSLLFLEQLDFKDKSVVLFHSSTVYGYETNLTRLRSDTISTFSNPLNSFLTP